MKIHGGVQYITVSTNSIVSTRPCTYYGCKVVNGTTGGVRALVFDAVTTAKGNLVDVQAVAAGTYANAGSFYSCGIAMRTGIYISAPICTTASDSIIVMFGGI